MNITGTYNNQTITGSAGNDTISGYFMRDTIVAGPGNDEIDFQYVSNLGENTVLYNPGDGNDTIGAIIVPPDQASSDGNTLTFGGGITASDVDIEVVNATFSNVADPQGRLYTAHADLQVNLAQGGHLFIPDFTDYQEIFSSPTDLIAIHSNGSPGVLFFNLQTAPRWTYLSYHQHGTAGNDVIADVVYNTLIEGGAGNDTYIDGGSYDTISDSLGFNTLDLSSNNYVTTINMLSGQANVFWHPGDIRGIIANSLDNLIIGDDYGDQIWGKDGNDTIIGGSGNDALMGGAGDDLLQGGIGNTTYAFYSGSGTDTIQDSGGWDQIKFLNNEDEHSVVFFEDSHHDLHIGYTNSTDQILVKDIASSGWIEHFQLQDGNFLTGSNLAKIVQDMSSYATSHGEAITSIDAVKSNPGLMAIITHGWHR